MALGYYLLIAPSPNPLFPTTALTAFGDNSRGGLGWEHLRPGTNPAPLNNHALGWCDRLLRLRMASRISPQLPSRVGGQGASKDAVPEQNTCSDKRQPFNSRNTMFNWRGLRCGVIPLRRVPLQRSHCEPVLQNERRAQSKNGSITERESMIRTFS